MSLAYIFLNENHIPFQDLDDAQLVSVVRAKMDGNCEFLSGAVWVDTVSDAFGKSTVYRVKPAKLKVNWDEVNSSIMSIALNSNGVLIGSAGKLRLAQGNNRWMCSVEFESFEVGHVLNIDTQDVDWRTSEVSRPVKPVKGVI